MSSTTRPEIPDVATGLVHRHSCPLPEPVREIHGGFVFLRCPACAAVVCRRR